MRRGRHMLAAGTAVVLAAGLALAGVAPAPAAAQPGGEVVVDAAVTDAIAEHGRTDFWVVLDEQADLSAAEAMTDWQQRGEYVYQTLRTTAEQTQGPLLASLSGAGASATGFWAANAVLVTGGDQAALDAARTQAGVARVTAAPDPQLPPPEPETAAPTSEVEWGVEYINAPQVWNEFDTRGEGVTVGVIDSGAQFDHPALVDAYRGNLGDGTFDHNYNWFDPSYVCGDPSLVPCDNTGHGTHVTGTIAGDGGEGNRIGVAPGATWMMAKGCEALFCSTRAITAAMQWMLAPTDLTGQNPRPELRPQLVNNSWVGGITSVMYQILRAWRAAGMVPIFAAGNDGPSCITVFPPAMLEEAYAVGAIDSDGTVAPFSARGNAAGPEPIKPDITAPGVDVRSAWIGGQYAVVDGTSMAAPHVSGTVALLLGAAPVLTGDVPAILDLLDQTAHDVADPSCEAYYPQQTAGNNATYGEGRLDAYAAASAAPRGAAGTVTGEVTTDGGEPVAGAEVTVETAEWFRRSATTDADGSYHVVAPHGVATLTVTAYGYTPVTRDIEVPPGQDVVEDVALPTAPRHRLTGTVLTAGGHPEAGATVVLTGAPLDPVTTDGEGRFTIPEVPAGEYRLAATGGRCTSETSQHVSVQGDTDVGITLGVRTGDYGYRCAEIPPDWVEGAEEVEGDVELPFPFRLYDETYHEIEVLTGGPSGAGSVSFSDDTLGTIQVLYHDDGFGFGDESSLRTAVLGEAPDRRFVIEWRDIRGSYLEQYRFRLSMQLILHENGTITMQYAGIDGAEGPDPWGRERGGGADIGIAQSGSFEGDRSFSYKERNEAPLSNEVAIQFVPPVSGVVEGVVTDANDGEPVTQAVVVASDADGEEVVRQQVASDGSYELGVPAGEITVEVLADHYRDYTETVEVTEAGQRFNVDAELPTGTLAPDVTGIEVVTTGQGERSRTVTVTNHGTEPVTYHAAEAPAAQPAGTEYESWNNGYGGTAYRSKGFGIDPATGNLLVGDNLQESLHEFRPDGTRTGRVLRVTPPDESGTDIYDMAHLPGGDLCMITRDEDPFLAGFTGIRCFDPATGDLTGEISGDFPWMSSYSLAYRPGGDRFYIGQRGSGRLLTVAGLSHDTPGEVLSACQLPERAGSFGLAWHPVVEELWAGGGPGVLRIDPETCGVFGEVPNHTGSSFRPLNLDAQGRAWGSNDLTGQVVGFETGIPVPADQDWLDLSGATSGTLQPGESAQITLTADAGGLDPGQSRAATLLITSNAGRDHGLAQIPVTIDRPLHRIAVNAGGHQVTDDSGEVWLADRRYSPWAGYGYTGWRTRVVRNHGSDAPLTARSREGDLTYRFDGLPDGVYDVGLRFAVPEGDREPTFDVSAGGWPLLTGYTPPAGEVDTRTVQVEVVDGTLRLSFTRRGPAPPQVSAISVTHRSPLPDG